MTRTRIIFSLLMVFALGACAGRTELDSDLGIKGAPDWVNKGTAYIDNDGGRLFHGVASAGAMGDESLQRAAADDRARAELARIFSSYLDVVSNDYQAAAKSGGTQVNEEAVSRQVKNLTKVNLSGAQVIARWKDKKSGALWAAAELDMKQVKQTIATTSDMDEGIRRYLANNADNIFDRVKEKK